MRRFLRWTGYVAGSLVLLAVIAVAAIWILGGQKLAAHGAGHPEHLAKPTPAQVADAPRQLAVLRCAGCHGKGLRGDLFFDEPYVAKIYAPNLTQIAFKASDEQLARAIRQGIGTDGRSLAIMPSATYARLDDSEVAAVIAAIRALPRGGSVHTAARGRLPWPGGVGDWQVPYDARGGRPIRGEIADRPGLTICTRAPHGGFELRRMPRGRLEWWRDGAWA